ncbi:NAD(P)-dependent oxidoreductase [Bosea sp. PAMC 26642]|uniref:NAD(P)-dependent oxidoreductase n=1 Tax=Bosea sp. (strain PAMC 26642) TaxID=1792307 RepID=UPI00076FFCC9|nr:NAD(P)-dependent oxidoreductase [Bosea sp. PAMC 26642]AMJ61120.1 hypothetical protein AXW83_13190 [Bosea sp. PAMC 26642]
MTERLDIAWVGLGEMGSRMAPRLAAAGHRTTAFDVNPAALGSAASSGLVPASSLAQALDGKQVAFSMLPHDGALLEIASDACDMLIEGAVFIDMSTVSPRVSAKIACDLAARGISYLRAPVSGSTALAEAGKLTVMVSGPQAAFDHCRSLLDVLGRSVHYLGGADEARTAKLVINTVVAGLNQSLAEALDLGRRGGLDWADMLEMLGQSAAACPYVCSKLDKLKRREWLPAAATINLLAKDVRLILDLARETGTYMPATTTAGSVLSAMEGRGCGALDICSVVSFMGAMDEVERGPD